MINSRCGTPPSQREEPCVHKENTILLLFIVVLPRKVFEQNEPNFLSQINGRGFWSSFSAGVDGSGLRYRPSSDLKSPKPLSEASRKPPLSNSPTQRKLPSIALGKVNADSAMTWNSLLVKVFF